MPKQSGLGMTLQVDDSAGTLRDISNDVGSLDFATPREEQTVTGIDSSAVERILLLADFSITVNIPAFNTDANMSHAVFRTVPSTSVARTTTATVASQILSNEVLYTDYSISRGDNGALGATAPGVLADGTVPTWTT